jgi:phenylalanyl-tRNA synthetase alpha chain
MEDKLKKLNKKALEEIKNCSNLSDLAKLRIKYLGRHGKISSIIHNLKVLPDNQKPIIGKLSNEVKGSIYKALGEKIDLLKKSQFENLTKEEWIDVTANPESSFVYGHLHPITRVLNEMIEIFQILGFRVVEGPEIETDWYNFEGLNIPPDHPARDTQDSFYLNQDVLLRTQTSPVQIRFMEKNQPPIRIIVPGRVYRRDSDATHTPMFNQLEGLLIDDCVCFADLKGTLVNFAHSFFGKDRKIRFRPHYFPFTEPSAEMDISCNICQGSGCRACKHTGWLEILGSGMVHPQVLKNGGIDPKKYQGFAFGLGIDRIAMLKYNIDDMRLLFENDLRFLEQF